MTQLRFVTAASLFDGHDVSINIMRRLLQARGVEVIHLGHNRSAREVVQAAIQEDAHAVALSSYQGGHNEYFTYIRQLLDKEKARAVRLFGGGGGVITPREIEELHRRGITRIYSPQDGMQLGLEGIVGDMIAQAQYDTTEGQNMADWEGRELSDRELAKAISAIENGRALPFAPTPRDRTQMKNCNKKLKSSAHNLGQIGAKQDRATEVCSKHIAGSDGEAEPQDGLKCEHLTVPVLGITGTGGAGKSSLIDELLLRFARFAPDLRVALISVDPTKKKTKGALLGDRIRLGAASVGHFFIRSLATRHSGTELSPHIGEVVALLRSQAFDLIVLETSGIGQAGDAITAVADRCLYVMTPEYGAATQLEKIEMLESADLVAINKFERPRSEDAWRDVAKQYRRNRQWFVGHPDSPADDELPIYGTTASQFNDSGVNALFEDLAKIFGLLNEAQAREVASLPRQRRPARKHSIIPVERSLYLREIAQAVRHYNDETERTVALLKDYQALDRANELAPGAPALEQKREEVRGQIGKQAWVDLQAQEQEREQLEGGHYSYTVRGREIKVPTRYTSLSGLSLPRVAVPKFDSLAQKYRFSRNCNLPGHFPFGAGIFPFRRADEEPKRMFAGEGGPARTNQRFHYLSQNDPFKRLSTAFDSVTLYGEGPDTRPDIFGKIGEAGVSIATLDDMNDLFRGFDLAHPQTSVSMTINGPASIILAMYMNTAIGQKLSGADFRDEGKRVEIMRQVRGTVQADILKEDQAQNTCIFSLEFSLKLMGDIQEYFCRHHIRNYYSVSVSGYHMAEAGANPITQAAFTLANGLTFVESYLARGLAIDDFAGNLSFFFSNGLDPEYAVIGRVARKIWAVTLRDRYGAGPKSQKFKYHIQTSGRSLHAQEIDFNDIRTTLQAFIALSDNCNSLHTNAYDEAITTPTEDSVRRAMAIQMIINREFGPNKTDNPLQGSHLVEALAELVEEGILAEFERLSDKGGVLGAMESMYQRSKIQEESLHYETLKDSGALPIIGVNTYLAEDSKEGESGEVELSRCSDEEKREQIQRLESFHKRHRKESGAALARLQSVALAGGNIFEELLSTVNTCSLGQITHALFEVGGRYRRNV